ncbi:MAG: hypothetical protein WCC40_18335, partial [Rhodomicrobium sp.]
MNRSFWGEIAKIHGVCAEYAIKSRRVYDAEVNYAAVLRKAAPLVIPETPQALFCHPGSAEGVIRDRYSRRRPLRSRIVYFCRLTFPAANRRRLAHETGRPP